METPVYVKDFVNLVLNDVRSGRIVTPECTVAQLPESKKQPKACSRCHKPLGILPRLFSEEGWRIIVPQSDDGLCYLICRSCMDEYQEIIRDKKQRGERLPEHIRPLRKPDGSFPSKEEELAALEAELPFVEAEKRKHIVAGLFNEAQALRRHQNYLYHQIELLRGLEYLRQKWKVGKREDGRYYFLGED